MDRREHRPDQSISDEDGESMRYALHQSCLICSHATLREGVVHCKNPDTLKEGLEMRMKYDAVCKRFVLRDFEYSLEMMI
jgi:hypothetical protein